MNKGVLFSIIIPSYNRASFLTKTIQSVLDQTFSNWECLIIDDGSTDNTKEILSSFKDHRIKYFYKENEERSIARNYGIERAVGEYICFLDSDDIYYPNHLESLNAKIKAENLPVAILVTGIEQNAQGNKIQRSKYQASEFGHPVYYIWRNFLLINSICVHKDILSEHQFPTEYNVWEDTHLWIRISALYPFYQISEVTTQWNIHDKGSVTQAFKKVQSVHVKNYINCIAHLFNNYGDIVIDFLDKNDMRSYQLAKLKMFMSIAFDKKQYFTFLNLYFYGVRKLGRVNVNSFAYPWIVTLLKTKLRSIRSI